MNGSDGIRIGVIGGGASGMMAAITAAGEGASVTLFEANERVGKKILSTGNGKCNLGNLSLDSHCYCGADSTWIENCLMQFDSHDCISFFRNIGLFIKEKNGYLYPVAEQAAVVLDVMRTELRTMGVELITECRVSRVCKEAGGGFTVHAGKQVFRFDKVILACGGKAAPKTGSDGGGYKIAKELGHNIIPVVPALVQLRCSEPYMKEVAGVRAEAVVRITDRNIVERGELQLVDYGLSGIPVFQLSRHVNYMLKEKDKNNVELAVDFLPDYDEDDFANLCAGRKLLQSDRTVGEFFTGILNKKLMYLFIKLAGLKRDMPVSDADAKKIEQVFRLCKDWRLHVTGSNSFENAQVCAGGVDTAQVGTNMESLIIPNLYFAGEILDVDGRCGGYNLQWAWCSGYIAGKDAAKGNRNT